METVVGKRERFAIVRPVRTESALQMPLAAPGPVWDFEHDALLGLDVSGPRRGRPAFRLSDIGQLTVALATRPRRTSAAVSPVQILAFGVLGMARLLSSERISLRWF